MRIMLTDPDRPSPLSTRACEECPFPMVSGMEIDGGGEVPFPTSTGAARTVLPSGQPASREYRVVAGRADHYFARRFHTHVALIAEGSVPYIGYETDFAVSPFLIYPPQFNFLFLIPNAPVLPALRPFRYVEVFPFPRDKSIVIIRDAEGMHRVQIEEAAKPAALFEGGTIDQAYFGFSKSSIESALDQAVAQAEADLAESDAADKEYTFAIVSSGKIKGGLAGRNVFYARIQAQS